LPCKALVTPTAERVHLIIARSSNKAKTRGNPGEAIFLDDKDRLKFLEYLEEGADRYGYQCIVTCQWGTILIWC